MICLAKPTCLSINIIRVAPSTVVRLALEAVQAPRVCEALLDKRMRMGMQRRQGSHRHLRDLGIQVDDVVDTSLHSPDSVV